MNSVTTLINLANNIKKRILQFQVIAKNNKKIFDIMAMDNGT